MDLAKTIAEFFGKPKEETEGKSPEGLCPVCWGHQEYVSKIRTLYADKQVDVNNNVDSYMLIQDFLVENINGIKLRDGEVQECPTCSSREETKK